MYHPEEVKALIINLAKEGKSMSIIGSDLRDIHGVPLTKPIVGYGIGKVLKEAGLAPTIPEDLYNLMRKVARLKRHLEKNTSDFSNKKSLHMVESRIFKLVKYYRKKGLLPSDWDYRSEIVTV